MTLELQLLRDYQGQPCEGWLMSQKLDGWRVLWTGTEFITREGNRLDAPKWFREAMPACALDGELFCGAGNFNLIPGMIRDGWHGLSFQVFDAPEVIAPFRKRYQFLKSLSLPSHVALVKQERCRDTQHLVEAADAVVDRGGEGMVVRNPRALYCHGRTDDVLRWVPQCPRINRRKVSAPR